MAQKYPQTELSRTLVAAREGRPGVTQQEVATALGVPFTYVSRWERAEVRPDLANLAKLAEFYELDLLELVRMRNEAPASGRASKKGREGALADAEALASEPPASSTKPR